MKYETILFDVDDTLFDFNLSEKNALNKTFMEFGLPEGLSDYRASYKQISSVLWAELEYGNMSLSELGVERFRRLFLKHDLKINTEEFGRKYLDHLGKQTHLIEGAFELCNSLTDFQLAVLSNSFQDVQEARIQGSPLRELFEVVITSEKAGYQKPDPRIFDYAFSELQIEKKAKVLIVGDSLTSDIQGGWNFGIDTCWFNPDQRINHTDILPTYEIKELTDLLKIVCREVSV